MKIYCKLCKFFDEGEKIPFSYGPPENDRMTQICEAPENDRDSHKKQDATDICIPWMINKFNDCIWFEPIEDDSSSGGASSSSSGSEVVDMPSSSSSRNI